jgi:hypothetical protein
MQNNKFVIESKFDLKKAIEQAILTDFEKKILENFYMNSLNEGEFLELCSPKEKLQFKESHHSLLTKLKDILYKIED